MYKSQIRAARTTKNASKPLNVTLIKSSFFNKILLMKLIDSIITKRKTNITAKSFTNFPYYCFTIIHYKIQYQKVKS